MKRGNFKKILGSNCIIIAAGSETAGYFLSDPKAKYPDNPWHTAGSLYQQPRMRPLSYAILAPNTYTHQFWLIQLDKHLGITLYLLTVRQKTTETDPFDRHILVSLKSHPDKKL